MYINININININIDTERYCMYICICMYVCVYVCMYVCICACVCVCVYMYIMNLNPHPRGPLSKALGAAKVLQPLSLPNPRQSCARPIDDPPSSRHVSVVVEDRKT